MKRVAVTLSHFKVSNHYWYSCKIIWL
jgi:hypothetical protein